MKKFFILFFSSVILFSESNLKAQISRKVLFLGNSYTGVNNLPQLVHDVALSAGDTLIFDSNTPGGYRLIDHGLDSISQSKIRVGDWNYVVLQGQSQEPIKYTGDFNNGCSHLNTTITQYNPCSVTMLYMTWGRKNGDAANCPSFPVMCTYDGMDSTIRNNYIDIATTIKGEISPVSVVWNYLRQNNPWIELYQSDESHPSLAGTYAAACSFYATIFKKDPTLITFDFGLSTTDANSIKAAAKIKVFDNLSSWNFKQLPTSDFRYSIGQGINEIIVSPSDPDLYETYYWDFGDGISSSTRYSTHSYLTDGTYTITLTTTSCDLEGLHSSSSDTTIQFCSHTPSVYTNDPWICEHDTLWTQQADSYQWYRYGISIPETDQALVNNHIYDPGAFSVMTTINGCTELSAEFSEIPEWSGYYFDLFPPGDPCQGETIPFFVRHINGVLSGQEIIEWYKNDTLLSFMNNEDTLLITSEGNYECRVVNPNSNCPIDTTTSSVITFNCSTINIDENNRESNISIFPNPATESITVKFNKIISVEEFLIYNFYGDLIQVINSDGASIINISSLTDGLYYIKRKNQTHSGSKFIKLSN